MGSEGGTPGVNRTGWDQLQILIVEPDEQLAATLADSLRGLGARVSRVAHGRSALAHLRGHPTDGVVLAAPLPDANWTGLATWILREPAAPLLIVLGTTEENGAENALPSVGGRGPDAVLERRAKPEEVCQAIEAAWTFRADAPAGDATASLPALLVALRDREESGVLEIRADGICTRIFFRRGAPVFAEGGALRETLGRMLLQRGALTEAEYLHVIERMTERLMESETTRMGEVLVELRLLTPAQVFAALSDQVREKILGCFHWEHFAHGFEPVDALPDELSAFPSLSLDALLLAGLRTHYGPQRLEPILAPFADRCPVLTEEIERLTARFQLAPAEQRLLKLCDRERTLADLRAMAPIDSVQAAQVLAALVLAHSIVWHDEPRTRPARLEAAPRPRVEVVRERPPPAPGPARAPASEAAAQRPPRAGIPRSLAKLRNTLARAGREVPVPIDPKSASLEAEQAFRQGLLCLERSSPAGALRAFGRACALRGDEPEYRMYEAWAALLAAPDDEARAVARTKAAACARRMLERNRDCPRAHGMLGQIQLATGDVAGAESHFRAVLRATPDDRDALRGMRMIERRRAGG